MGDHSTMSQRARHWALLVKRDVHAIYCAARDPRVPWYAKALAICVAGYALSPIDLIPDFVPVWQPRGGSRVLSVNQRLLERLEAENAVLRSSVVELVLQIQALRDALGHPQSEIQPNRCQDQACRQRTAPAQPVC